MRIAVLGTGGTGGYFGGLLARAGEDVTFLARGKHLDAIEQRGLVVKSRLVGDFSVKVTVTDHAQAIGAVDLLLICVKTYDMLPILEFLPSLVHSETIVLSMQNGIHHEKAMTQVIGERAVVGAVAFVTSMIQAPGIIAQTAGLGKILLGELGGGTSPRLEQLRSILERAHIPTELHQDIQAAIWEKFLFVSGFGGVTALTRLPIGTIVANPETRLFLQGVMEEVEAVARAHGMSLSDGCVERYMDLLARWEPWGRGSLSFDLENHKRLELDALNGAVVRLGEQSHIPTPLNFAIYASLKPFIHGGPPLPQG